MAVRARLVLGDRERGLGWYAARKGKGQWAGRPGADACIRRSPLAVYGEGKSMLIFSLEFGGLHRRWFCKTYTGQMYPKMC